MINLDDTENGMDEEDNVDVLDVPDGEESLDDVTAPHVLQTPPKLHLMRFSNSRI